MEMFITLHKNL